MRVSREQARKLVGKTIYAVRKDGSIVTGKLVRAHQNKLYLQPGGGDKGKTVKTVKTKAILPLVLFDLLAIGTLPYAFGGGYGGFGGGIGGCCGGGFGPEPYGPGPIGPGAYGPYGGFDGGCCQPKPFGGGYNNFY